MILWYDAWREAQAKLTAKIYGYLFLVQLRVRETIYFSEWAVYGVLQPSSLPYYAYWTYVNSWPSTIGREVVGVIVKYIQSKCW